MGGVSKQVLVLRNPQLRRIGRQGEKGPAIELGTYTLHCGVSVMSLWSQLKSFIPNRP